MRPEKREKNVSDAPCDYNREEARAWSDGYNTCLEQIVEGIGKEKKGW